MENSPVRTFPLSKPWSKWGEPEARHFERMIAATEAAIRADLPKRQYRAACSAYRRYMNGFDNNGKHVPESIRLQKFWDQIAASHVPYSAILAADATLGSRYSIPLRQHLMQSVATRVMGNPGLKWRK